MVIIAINKYLFLVISSYILPVVVSLAKFGGARDPCQTPKDPPQSYHADQNDVQYGFCRVRDLWDPKDTLLSSRSLTLTPSQNIRHLKIENTINYYYFCIRIINISISSYGKEISLNRNPQKCIIVSNDSDTAMCSLNFTMFGFSYSEHIQLL